jgi:hypothetical protein
MTSTETMIAGASRSLIVKASANDTRPNWLAALLACAPLLFASCGASSVNTTTETPFSNASAPSYVSGFRPAYLPVVTTLNQVTPACADASRANQLPACGVRVAAFRAATARLERFVTHTAPPPKAKEAAREMAASLRIMQARFTTLAALIKRKDLAGFLAMGGPGRPIDKFD